MNDRRLLACAALCKPGKAVDVGTDHGYLAIHLVKTGICGSCIACDINTAPLDSARKNIREAGLSDRIETVLTDGLDGIGGEDVNDETSLAGRAYKNVAERIMGGDVPFIDFEQEAIKNKNVELTDFLIDNGARINYRDSVTGNTPLYIALKNDMTNTSIKLIKKGASINQKAYLLLRKKKLDYLLEGAE